MADRIRIVLFGNSIYLAGLAVSLKAEPLFDVTHIPLLSTSMEQDVASLKPALILFDLNQVPADLSLFDLSTSTFQKMIGVDIVGEDVLLMSCQKVRIATMNDMIRLITVATGSKIAQTGKDAKTGEDLTR